MAAKQVSAGQVRINGARAGKPAQTVTQGDVLTFVQARRARVVKVVGLGARRGPAPEAQTLYEDLTPAEPDPSEADRPSGARPTKRDRRALERFRHPRSGDEF